MSTDLERGQRLAQARVAKGYETGAAGARALRLDPNLYNQYENGTRGFRLHATRFASFYGVQLAWLWSGEGPMRKGGKEPIVEKFEALTPENRPEAIRYLDYLISTQKPG